MRHLREMHLRTQSAYRTDELLYIRFSRFYIKGLHKSRSAAYSRFRCLTKVQKLPALSKDEVFVIHPCRCNDAGYNNPDHVNLLQQSSSLTPDLYIMKRRGEIPKP